ncbi:major facilitator superfamily domain-containing protein 6-A [Galendromus occidentalis]|uniref:Major facilitator superfamily domain-containing protein 6-A n=1 Tax=Galendromus occidentalis TaxID=34638 RepID=A0AAJ6QNX9_9ACAR|nr:major facilitator superfamily domain-containing protein 6-A [Galendromus occidentalis]
MWGLSSDLYPIKAHFFLYNGAQACYLNYLAVVGKQAGVSASTTGIIFGVAPLITTIMKPIVGAISDRIQNITAVIMVSEILLMAFCWGVFLAPEWSSRLLLNRSFDLCPQNFTTEIENFANGTECTLSCESSTRSIYIDNPVSNCNASCSIDCISADSHLSTLGLLMYIVSILLTSSLAATLYSISDAACFATLGPKRDHLYGRQRLWGTLSWGIISPAIGAIIDASSSGGQTDFSASVIGFTILICINIVMLYCAPRFKTPVRSNNFFSDLKDAFTDVDVIIFSVWVFFCGVFIGNIWTYSVWLLEELDASKTLTGLTYSVQSLLIEIPMFFIAGYLIERLGYFGCMTTAFICFGIKLLGYSLLVNPWYALLVDIVGGAVFPMFYAATTAFANQAAAPGTSATMQCLFGAIYEGLGMAVGSFLGGSLIQPFGAKGAFRIFGMMALVCALLCSLTSRVNPSRIRSQGHDQTPAPDIHTSYGSVDTVSA